MTDLISRSAVIDIIDEERRFIESLRETVYDNEDRAHNTGELGCAIRLARKIKGLSTIDAVPVVHARWIHDINNLYGCSECMARETMSHKKLKKFCPNCGARMDAEEKPDAD